MSGRRQRVRNQALRCHAAQAAVARLSANRRAQAGARGRKGRNPRQAMAVRCAAGENAGGDRWQAGGRSGEPVMRYMLLYGMLPA